ncbi:hypothetical protein [Polynucleobacter alcilacus]|nr:hypothetical protein [Polynucleobacter alcilacus]
MVKSYQKPTASLGAHCNKVSLYKAVIDWTYSLDVLKMRYGNS